MDICGHFCDYGHFSKLFSERHLTIFDEISKLAEVIVSDGDLNKIDKMYQIRYINFEGESWWVNAKYFLQFCAANWILILRVVDSNRKLYIAHEIRKLFGLDFTCVDVSDIIETGTGWNRIHLMMKTISFLLEVRQDKIITIKLIMWTTLVAYSQIFKICKCSKKMERSSFLGLGTFFRWTCAYTWVLKFRNPDRVDVLPDNSQLCFP